jgi:hypothetical protein
VLLRTFVKQESHSSSADLNALSRYTSFGQLCQLDFDLTQAHSSAALNAVPATLLSMPSLPALLPTFMVPDAHSSAALILWCSQAWRWQKCNGKLHLKQMSVHLVS